MLYRQHVWPEIQSVLRSPSKEPHDQRTSSRVSLFAKSSRWVATANVLTASTSCEVHAAPSRPSERLAQAHSMPPSSTFLATAASEESEFSVASSENAMVACTLCGYVETESHIVQEVGFQEDSRGNSSIIGQYVPNTGPRNTAITGKHGPAGHSRESREVTISTGKRNIMTMAAALRISNSAIEAAQKIFVAALGQAFVHGRRTKHVLAACLYVACRREKSAHMLIDFSEHIATNLFVVGNTVLKLVRALNLRMPLVDPSMYMHRFANQLELGQQAHQVSMMALKLMAHMRRDWMIVGRRPSGIW